MSLKLNITGALHSKVVVDENLARQLVKVGLKLGDRLDPILLSLDPLYVYEVTGGSDLAGSPMRKYVNLSGAIKERVVSRKRKLRVVGRYVSARTSCLNIVTRLV